MPYTCNTCGKTHDTGKICTVPSDQVYFHMHTHLTSRYMISFSDKDKKEFTSIAFNDVEKGIECINELLKEKL